jgi:hypothetical protein
MDVTMVAVAERLASEFQELPSSAVISMLTDCVHEFPHKDPNFIEQAVRARLSLARTVMQRIEHDDQETVDLSLHDADRGKEVELTARLIVAANASRGSLNQAEIDAMLDIT